MNGTVSDDFWIREVVRKRYCLEFQSIPPAGCLTITHSAGKDNPIRHKVTKLLEKKAVEKVPHSEIGYYSTFFL